MISANSQIITPYDVNGSIARVARSIAQFF